MVRRPSSARSDRLSYWLDSRPAEPRSPGKPRAGGGDVVVVGSGIVGLTCALLLANSGCAVVVLEADAVAAGVSGYTTAKLTAGHGLRYADLERAFGETASARYAEAQTAGLSLVRELCGRYEIDCDLEVVENYVFAERVDELDSLAEEAEAAARAGLPARLENPLDVPFPAVAAVVLADQAQIHPRKYLLALAARFEAAGGTIHERTRVTAIEGNGDGPFTVIASGVELRAAQVVVATHYPIVDQGFFATRIHPRRSYVVAAPLADRTPDGMFVNVGTPTRSLRTTPLDDGRRLLLVGGEGHRVGHSPEDGDPYDALERYLRAHFDAGEVTHRWSTQDTFPVDRLPYVGRAGDAEGLFVATGFAGWGMTNGSAAGLTLAGAVQGREQPWSELFELERSHLRASAGRFVGENVNVALRQLKGALAGGSGSVEPLPPGAGAVASIDGKDTAVSRAADGTIHAVSATCTHMGCTVAWNHLESSWDCPCHGSRFAPDGAVLHGPALRPLETVELGDVVDGSP